MPARLWLGQPHGLRWCSPKGGQLGMEEVRGHEMSSDLDLALFKKQSEN